MYTKDQWAVMSVLGADIPKRPTMKTAVVAEKAFKGDSNADRRTRNAYRKLRAEGHVEIADRGEYRLTATGVTFFKKNKSSFTPKEARKRGAPTTKKVAKKTTKRVEKAATKKVDTKKAAKKTTKKAAKKTAKKATRKSPTKAAPENGGSNGTKTTKTKSRPVESSGATATLSF